MAVHAERFTGNDGHTGGFKQSSGKFCGGYTVIQISPDVREKLKCALGFLAVK